MTSSTEPPKLSNSQRKKRAFKPTPKRTDLSYLRGWFLAGGLDHKQATEEAKKYRALFTHS